MTNTNTENHNLLTHDQGDPNWHEELDANRQDYDTKLPIVDTDANRTNYTAKEDALYFAYDTGKWYRGGGTNWVEKLSAGAPSDAQFVTLATDSDLTNERTLNAGSLLSLTDNGAGNDVSLDVDESSIDHDAIDQATVSSDDHHTKYDLTDDRIATGNIQLSSGVATVDTGVAKSNTATFNIYLGPATDDAQVAADIVASSSSGNYEVQIQETDTSVGNPTVEYDIVRFR